MGRRTGMKLDYLSYSELPATNSQRSVWQETPIRLLTRANFAILPASLHRRSYRVTFDPDASETKKMIFSLNIGKNMDICGIRNIPRVKKNYVADAADKLDRGTQVYSAGSKSLAAIKEPANRIHFLSGNVEPLIKQKLTKASSIKRCS